MDQVLPLNQIRAEITTLDKDLLALLAKRRNLSIAVARSKESDIRPIRDVQRETELLTRLVQLGREQGLDAHYVMSIYQNIIEDSVLNQQAFLQGRVNPESAKKQLTIAYLGARGSYSFLAATRYCQRRQVQMQDLGCQNFIDIIRSVELGHADYGFLPIENTSSGSINEVYDALQHTNLSIIGETTIEISHCLLAKTGNNLANIKTVYAHHQPISQCSRYLSEHPEFKLEYCSSSAEAMEKALNGNDQVAAIGSAEGGALYQLQPLAYDLANQQVSQTRFIVVARKAVTVPEQIPAKTTLIMATGQKPGSLVDILLELKKHNLNMCKLESRPIIGTPWEEMFYLDIEANINSEAMQQVIKAMEKLTRFIKVLGSYPSETVKPTQLSNKQLLIEPESSKQHVFHEITNDTDPALRYSRQYKPTNTVIKSGTLTLGKGEFTAWAQLELPESATQFAPIANRLKEAGFQAIIFNKINAQQHAEKTLIELKRLSLQFNLQTIAVIEQESDLAITQSTADMLLLTGKQMYNTPLLVLLGQLNIPVILERNSTANAADWLASANSVLTEGNQQLILSDAGVSGYNHELPLLLDLATLTELKNSCHLPVIINLTATCTEQTRYAQANAIKQLGGDGIILTPSLTDPSESRQLLASIYS